MGGKKGEFRDWTSSEIKKEGNTHAKGRCLFHLGRK